MRSIICLFLAFSRESEYDRGWSHISYALMSLGATEEDTFVIFSHLVMNVLPVKNGFLTEVSNKIRDFLMLQITARRRLN
jgi:hypothetical protein